MSDLKSITSHANLIIANSHEFSDISRQFKGFQIDLYAYLGLLISDISWVDLIEVDGLNEDLRKALITLDDCLDLHNNIRYVL